MVTETLPPEMSDQSLASANGWGELLGPRYLAITIMLSIGIILFAFNTFLVATALPSAIADIGGLDLISWSLTLFLTFGIIGGSAAANLKAWLGGRRLLIISSLVFMVGILLSGEAQTMPQLLVGRAIAGFSDGVVSAVCYALIPVLFPSNMVPKVFGVEALAWGSAAFGGPLLAGALTEAISWRAAFLFNVPLALIFIVMTLKCLPKEEAATSRPPLPLIRLIAIGAAIMALAVAAALHTAATTIGLTTFALVTLAAVVIADRRAKERLFPADAFRFKGTVALGLWTIFLMPIAQSASSVYSVYLVEKVWGFSTVAAGFTFTSLAISWSIVALIIANDWAASHRPILISIGAVLLFFGMGAITLALVTDYVPLVIVGQILIGSGFGSSWAFLSQTVMETAAPADRDRAASLVPTLNSAGYAVGAAVAGIAANLAGLPDAVSSLDIRHAALAPFLLAGGFCVLSILSAVAVKIPAKEA